MSYMCLRHRSFSLLQEVFANEFAWNTTPLSIGFFKYDRQVLSTSADPPGRYYTVAHDVAV